MQSTRATAWGFEGILPQIFLKCALKGANLEQPDYIFPEFSAYNIYVFSGPPFFSEEGGGGVWADWLPEKNEIYM